MIFRGYQSIASLNLDFLLYQGMLCVNLWNLIYELKKISFTRIFAISLLRQKGGMIHLNKLEIPVCACFSKFGANYPSGSEEDEEVKKITQMNTKTWDKLKSLIHTLTGIYNQQDFLWFFYLLLTTQYARLYMYMYNGKFKQNTVQLFQNVNNCFCLHAHIACTYYCTFVFNKVILFKYRIHFKTFNHRKSINNKNHF